MNGVGGTDEAVRELQSKVAALEEKINKASPPKLIELAETSFKSVLDADYHLDDKASRILSAMAFLTAAAAAIFAKAYSPAIPISELQSKVTQSLSPFIDQQSLPAVTANVVQGFHKTGAFVLGVDMSLLTFFGYVLFVLVGAAFYLAALGPSLNKPSEWVGSGSDKIQSRLFYDFIAQAKRTAWKAYWKGGDEAEHQQKLQEIETEMEGDYIFESHLLAEKAKAKFLLMSLGSICFRAAILCLIALVASLFADSLRLTRMLTFFGWSLMFGVLAFEHLIRPPRKTRRVAIFGSVALICLITLVVVTFI